MRVTTCIDFIDVSVMCYLFVSFYSLFCRSLDLSSTSINTQQFDPDMNKELYEPSPRLQFWPMTLRRISQQNEEDGVIGSENNEHNGVGKSGGSSVFASDQGITDLKAHVHPNGFARLCFCFETILLLNAVF